MYIFIVAAVHSVTADQNKTVVMWCCLKAVVLKRFQLNALLLMQLFAQNLMWAEVKESSNLSSAFSDNFHPNQNKSLLEVSPGSLLEVCYQVGWPSGGPG